MEILKILTLRGPNMWSRNPCLEVWIDLGALKDSASNEMPGFNQRLTSWLPTMIEHRCSVGERGGFFQRLERGTYLAHILEHVTLELQTLAGTSVGFGRARETETEGLYKVAIRYQEEELARDCLKTGRELCLAAVAGRDFDINGEVKRLRELADKLCLGPSTSAIVEAAKARGIPHHRLNSGSLVQLGQGAQQRRIWTAETDRTGAIAEWIAQDKELTKQLLRSVGVPVPEGRVVDSADDAWEAARDIDGPVVVKPRDANHGRGVFMDLTTEAQVREAFPFAEKEGSGVMVERFAPGVEHRLLVIDGRLIAAARGELCCVVGNGRDTIEELVAVQLNTDPRRGVNESDPLSFIEFDAPVLHELTRQGYTKESRPADGTRVLIQRIDSLSNDVTDEVHPDVAAAAIAAAQVVGLDIAGLDVVCTNIGEPLESQGGVVVEVNAGPGLLMHLKPATGAPRPVGEAIVGTMFPAGATGRIPLVAVTGTNGKTTVVRLLDHLLRRAGRHVGMTCSEGVFINQRRIHSGDCSGPRSARNVLLNPLVDAAVFECGRGGMLREGLGFDRCDVAVVTNIAQPDHLGLSYIEDAEAMYTVKRTPVDVVLPTGTAVLNADDPLVARMAELSAGGVTFFSRDPQNPLVSAHRQTGGRVVVQDGAALVLCEGPREVGRIDLAGVPVCHGGRVPFQTENVLAALAAGWALNLPPSELASGLQTFQGTETDLPGRFNVFQAGDATVIVDDVHNVAGLTALVAALDNFSATSRSIVYSMEGDRRDEDARMQGALLAAAFDRVTLYDNRHHCGRAPGETARLLQAGMAGGGRVAQTTVVGNYQDGVQRALDALLPGELLIIQTEDIADALDLVKQGLGLSRESTRAPVAALSRT